MQPLQRNGLRPTQLLAALTEKTKRVTMDDIRKEKIIAALPTDVQRSIMDKVEELTAEETARLADRFFDKEGKPLQPPSSAAINHVGEGNPYTTAYTEDEQEQEINAVPTWQRKKGPQRSDWPKRQPPKTQSGAQPKGQQPKIAPKPLCWRHAKFGKDAKFCEEGCALFTPDQSKEQAGRRA